MKIYETKFTECRPHYGSEKDDLIFCEHCEKYKNDSYGIGLWLESEFICPDCLNEMSAYELRNLLVNSGVLK